MTDHRTQPPLRDRLGHEHLEAHRLAFDLDALTDDDLVIERLGVTLHIHESAEFDAIEDAVVAEFMAAGKLPRTPWIYGEFPGRAARSRRP